MSQSVMEPKNVVAPFLRIHKTIKSFILAEGLEQVKGVPTLWSTPERVEMAGGPGFEPGLTGPEPVVLPLDDPPVLWKFTSYRINFCRSRKFSFLS